MNAPFPLFDDIKRIFIMKRTSSGSERAIKELLNDNKLFRYRTI